MNFGQALESLKAGKRVARDSWNGKGMWLVLVKARRAQGNDPFAEALVRIPVGAMRMRDGDVVVADWLSGDRDGSLRLLPWIGMKTADDGFVPWFAGQTDLLAEDWVVIA